MWEYMMTHLLLVRILSFQVDLPQQVCWFFNLPNSGSYHLNMLQNNHINHLLYNQ